MQNILNTINIRANLIYVFGSIHKTYNLDVLIDTVIKMDLDNLAVTFIGPGLDKAELKEMIVGHEDIFAFLIQYLKMPYQIYLIILMHPL